jgi:hypothetical protein
MNTSVLLGGGCAVVVSMVIGMPGRALAQTNSLVTSPAPLPPGAERSRSHVNGTLLGIGISTMVFSYGPAVAIGIVSDHKGDEYLFIPVAGPWVDLHNRGCTGPTIETPRGPFEIDSFKDCGTSAIERAALITSGALQGIGALAIMGSFFVTPDKRPSSAFEAPQMPPFSIVPSAFGGRGVGAIANGRF